MNIDEKTLREIVAQVMAAMQSNGMVRCYDPQSGVMSINGSAVELEPFDTGKPGDQVWLKDVITSKENKNLAAGYMLIKGTEFPWTLTYDEVDYIIDGELTIKINGKEIVGKAGDMICIPKGSSIIWSAKDHARFVYITYPANWSELV